MSEFAENISLSNTEKSTSPERTVSAPVETYYSGCALVMSSPAEISLYFGRYILKGLDDGRLGLSQIYEKQVYMTVDEAEKLAEAILKTVQMFRSRRAETFSGAQGTAGSLSAKDGKDISEFSSGNPPLIKI